MQHSVFAMELCFRMEPGSTLRDTLRAIVLDHPAASGLHQKWDMYRRARDAMLAHLDRAELGCWDFFDDDARARRDYEMWCNGMLTEEGVRPAPSGAPTPYRGDAPRYMTFTVAFQLVQGAPSERGLARVCHIPEARLWHRQTFHAILSGLSALSFASVKSDVAYLIPRDEDWGLTAEDLQLPKFHYLRRLV